MTAKITLLTALALVVSTSIGCDQAKSQSRPVNADGTGTAPPSVSAPAAVQSNIADPSPHFNRVLSRVDVGGKLLRFQDHEGNRKLAIDVIGMLIGMIPETSSQKEIDVPKLVDAIGLGNSLASGRSVRKEGDAWLMRDYAYCPKGRGAFGKLLGDDAVPFRSPDLLPAATDLVIESRLNCSDLPGLITKIAEAVGQPQVGKKWTDEKLPNGESMMEFAKKFDLHVIAGVDVSYWRALTSPVDFYVQIDGPDGILNSFIPQIEGALGKSKAIGTRRGWEIPLPAVAGQPKAKAVILIDPKGRLIAASRKKYLAFVESDSLKIGKEKEFMNATAQFPKKGNLMIYGSKQLPSALAVLLRKRAKSMDSGGEILAQVANHLKPQTWSLCVSYEPDGTTTVAKLPFPGDASVGKALPVMSAVSTMFIGARAWKRGSDRAECILNIRNVQQGVRSYQNMYGHKMGSPLDWKHVIRRDGFVETPPICPAGGTYTFSLTIPEVGDLACRCSHAKVDGHVPAQHQDW